MPMKEIEVWVLVDEDGDYVASHDADLLKELYEEQITEWNAGSVRRICLTVSVPLPTVIALTGSVPADAEPSALVVK